MLNLFSNSFFINGASRAFDYSVFNLLDDDFVAPKYRDYLALKRDWINVGAVLDLAIKKYELDKNVEEK